MAPRPRVTSVVDAIADDLRARLFDGSLAPGASVTEALVAESYDVARPTAKAAIEKLVGESLLDRGVHKSARVRELDAHDVRDVYRTRAMIESSVLRRLAETRMQCTAAREANQEIADLRNASALDVVDPDMRFHTALVDALASPRMSRIYRSLVGEVRVCMAQVQGRSLLPTTLIHAEHARLVELVAAGDGDGAVALLEEHLARARERLAAKVGGVPGPEAQLSDEPPWSVGAS
ncbi:MAG: GntR family transcriptional regulator [Cellulomonadaceae bacterium]